MLRVIIYFLYPFSVIYAFIIQVRNLFFDIGFFRCEYLPVPVISVGNITTGGTGKTPAVAFIVRQLQDDGYRVGVVSRGYKRSSRGYVLISDGKSVIVDAEMGGDEPVMLARSLPGAIVAVDENRARGGKSMLENFQVDVIILDDGFQHRALHRDLDIVLVNASKQEHLRAHLPAGRLRESLRSLRRADMVLVTKFDSDLSFTATGKLISRYTTVPVIGSTISPVVCVDIVQDAGIPIESLKTKSAYLFSGIADPENFYKTVRDLEISVKGVHRFKDHHRFNENDINEIFNKAKASGAEVILTTEKDAVRLYSYKKLFIKQIPLYVLRVSLTMTTRDKGVLNKYMQQVMNRYKRSVNIN